MAGREVEIADSTKFPSRRPILLRILVSRPILPNTHRFDTFGYTSEKFVPLREDVLMVSDLWPNWPKLFIAR